MSPRELDRHAQTAPRRDALAPYGSVEPGPLYPVQPVDVTQPLPQQRRQSPAHAPQPVPSNYAAAGAQQAVVNVGNIGPSRSVTKQRKSTSHGLHLFLTIITGGVWGLCVWLPITMWHKMGPKKKITTEHY